MPVIRVIIDEEQDIGRFIRFLNHPNYPGKRRTILDHYPEIAAEIARGKRSEDSVVREIVGKLYATRRGEIEAAAVQAESAIRNAEPAFTELAHLMHCENLHEKEYTAILTLLPFSPLKENLFYCSIYWVMFKTNEGVTLPLRAAEIALHEVSHFIFFEQLREWEELRATRLPHAVQHYVKESLTAAILNQERMRGAGTGARQKPYRGNQELHNLNIEHEGVTQNIVEWMDSRIFRNDESYRDALFRVLDTCRKNAEQFAEKWELWNAYLTKPDATIKEEYGKPIRI